MSISPWPVCGFYMISPLHQWSKCFKGNMMVHETIQPSITVRPCSSMIYLYINNTQKIVSFHSIAKGCRIGLPCVSIEFVHPFLPDQLNPTCAIPTAIIYGCIAPKKAVKHTCTKRCLSVHHFPGQLPSLSSILVLVSMFLLLDDESPTCTWWHPSDILPDIYSEFYLPYIRAFLSHDLAVYLTFYVTLWHFIWHIFWHGFLAFYPLVN